MPTQQHYLPIASGVSVFANGPGDLGSIPGRVIPKTQKMVLDASLLNTQHYKVRIKSKVEQSKKGVAPSLTHWCSSYRKGSLRVTLDYGRQLYFMSRVRVRVEDGRACKHTRVTVGVFCEPFPLRSTRVEIFTSLYNFPDSYANPCGDTNCLRIACVHTSF